MLSVIVITFITAVDVVVLGQDITGKDYYEMPTLFHLDDYDKCMLIEDQGFYCSLNIYLTPLDPNDLSKTWKIIQKVSGKPSNYRHDYLRHGICVPEYCPNARKKYKKVGPDLANDLSQCYSDKYKNLGLKAEVNVTSCRVKNVGRPVDTIDVFVGIVFIAYFLFVVWASIYEGRARYETKEVYEKIIGTPYGAVLAAFSLPKNWYRLTSMDNLSEEKLRPMQAIKFYNMFCVILCHTVMVSFAGPIQNTQYPETITEKVLNMFLANGGYAVQTFFLISGWLLSYHFFRIMEGKKKFNLKYILMAFVNRYVRLTPLLLVIIAFHATWLVHLADGPMWDRIVGREFGYCRKNWWTNLLYVNNYVGKEEMCMQQTWYLAADTQLFLVSLLVLAMAWTYKKYTKLILGATLVVGIALPGIISYLLNSDIVIRQYPEPLYEYLLLNEDWHQLYSSAQSNFGGYAIGLCFGYVFYLYRNEKVTVTKMHALLWWLLTFGMCIFIILVAGWMYKEDFTFNRIGSAAYWAFGRNIFALGIAIGIYGITLDIGWFAKWFLQWRNAQILGRLTYSTYLIHVAFVKLRGGTLRSPLYISDYYLFFTAISDICLSFMGGFVLCLAFEMPISALQKLFVPQITAKQPRNSEEEKTLKTLDYVEEEDAKAKL